MTSAVPGTSSSGAEDGGESSSSGSGVETSTGSSESGSSTSGDPGVPGYTPFFRMDCNDGTLGEEAVGADGLETAIRVVYSDAEAVDGQGQSCRTWIDAGQSFFGGRYVRPTLSIGDGDDLWMRQGVFFPDGFCFGYGDTPGDGWGALKWMRVEFDNGDPGDRLTLQLGNFAAQGCNAQSEIYGATREYAGNANLRPRSSPPIETGRWHMLQWHVHLAADDSAFVRFWLDDVFVGQVDEVTMSAPERTIGFIQYGDYWNGTPYENASWYTDEVIMTVETPDTLDAVGQPYIDPSARADDWD